MAIDQGKLNLGVLWKALPSSEIPNLLKGFSPCQMISKEFMEIMTSEIIMNTALRIIGDNIEYPMLVNGRSFWDKTSITRYLNRKRCNSYQVVASIWLHMKNSLDSCDAFSLENIPRVMMKYQNWYESSGKYKDEIYAEDLFKIGRKLSADAENYLNSIRSLQNSEKTRKFSAWLQKQKTHTNIEELDLYNLGLQLLPSEILFCTNLKSLCLIRNSLSYLPSFICKLHLLENLSLGDFYYFPKVLYNLPKLKSLYIDNRMFDVLPDDIEKLGNLEVLSLRRKPFRCKVPALSLPEKIGELSSLKKICIDEVVNVPESIGNLTKLKELYLHNGSFENLPKSIGMLSNLKILTIGSNELMFLPVSLKNLSKLETLDITCKNIENIPVEIFNLPNIKRITLNGKTVLSKE